MMKEKLSYEDLLVENEMLRQSVLDLMLRVQDLEKQIGKTSANSSKPPSTNGYKKVVQNNREKTDKKSGGQPNHKGNYLKYAEGEDIDELSYVSVSGSCSCGADLSTTGLAIEYERRQVFEIPRLRPYVTEYQVERKQCSCGKIHRAVCEEAPYAVQYGSNVSAGASYFHNRQLLPIKRTQEILSDIFGFTQISEGFICNSSSTGYDRLSEWEEVQIVRLQNSPILHVDETGLGVGGKRIWGHVGSTKEITLYQHHAKRGKLAHEAHKLLDKFTGVLVHDRYSSYNSYSCSHSLCNAHLLRELKSLIEDGQIWAKMMYKLLNEAHKDIINAIDLEKNYQEALKLGFIDNPLPDYIPKQKGKIKKTASQNLLECFKNRKTEILRFYYQQDVPFDNNLAERDLRMFKLKQKINGTFRTENGAKYFCRIASFIATLKKQGANVWENLCQLYQHKHQYSYNPA